MRAFDDFAAGLRRSGTPATIGLIGGMAVAYLLAWFGLRNIIGPGLGFDPASALGRPWTLLTYPFASLGNGSDLIWFLLSLLWVWFMGGAIERELGAQRFIATFFAFTLLGALAMLLGRALLGTGPALLGPMIPASALTMIWAARNPEQSILLMMVIPLKGKYLAILTVVLVIFPLGASNPLLGVIAALPLGLAWLWASGKLPVAYPVGVRTGRSRADRKAEERRHFEFQEAIRKKQQDRDERERLRKLFESSLDPKDDR